MSYRNDTDATYDRTLLSSVPDPTRAEKQEGYNVDLLDEGHERRPASPPVPTRQPTDQQPLTEGHTPGSVAGHHKEGQLENGARPAGAKGPWYRTRWGIMAIIIVFLLIVGGVVGGVVGGTHHSSHKTASNSGGGNPNPQPNSTVTGQTANSPTNQNGFPTTNTGAGQLTGAASSTGGNEISGGPASSTNARATPISTSVGNVPVAGPST